MSQFKAGQELVTDKEFELAITAKELVGVFQSGIRLRPISTIESYNDKSVRIADGVRFLRNANKFIIQKNEE